MVRHAFLYYTNIPKKIPLLKTNKFGAAKSINKYLRVNICVVWGEYLALKYIFIDFAVPNIFQMQISIEQINSLCIYSFILSLHFTSKDYKKM